MSKRITINTNRQQYRLNRTGFEQEGNERIPYPTRRHTKYFWVINPRMAAYTPDQAEWIAKRLEKLVLRTFLNVTDTVAFRHPNHRFDRRYVDSHDLQISVEVGPKHFRVHCNVIQSITHRSHINVDPKDVRRLMNRHLEEYFGPLVSNIHVKRTYHPSTDEVLFNYIAKTAPTFDARGMAYIVKRYEIIANDILT